MRSHEHEKLGLPDYTGEWISEKYDISSGEFSMHVLERTQGELSTDPPSKTKVHVNHIEGVIFDKHGLSVFSGVQAGDIITFIKTYSASARRQGGIPYIEYQGKLDENSNEFNGQFSDENGVISGKFVLRPSPKNT